MLFHMDETGDTEVNLSHTEGAYYNTAWSDIYSMKNFSSEIMENLDYSSLEYVGEIKKVPAWEMSLKIIVYSLIMCLALVGNLLIIIVVGKNKRMQSTTNYFIVNLAISDLLVTCCCTWVRLVDDITEGWVLGDFFCKVNSAAQGKMTDKLFHPARSLLTEQYLLIR